MASALLIAGVACARGDVQMSGGVGSGGIAPANTQAPDATQEPTGYMVSTVFAFPTASPSHPEPISSPTLPPTPTLNAGTGPESVLYESQPGDTLRTVAVRFGVVPSDLRTSQGQLPSDGLIDPGTLLVIPKRLSEVGPSERLIPDSELIYSPHAAEFDTLNFAAEQGGYLIRYGQYIGGKWLNGAEVVQLAAIDHSINPRILLAFVEYHSNWVTNSRQPVGNDFDYPLGIVNEEFKGLYRQLVWITNELGKGYYGWRAGTLTDLILLDGSYVRLDPTQNAGTVSLQYIFGLRSNRANWEGVLGPDGFIATYERLFGDPWSYSHPLFEPGVEQPDLILPFTEGRMWSFTGGPHGAWEREAAWAALDFAPASTESGCVPSDAWIVASAAGLVLRSENGLVVIDLDGDGREQTGWVLLYLHVATQSRVQAGIFVEQGDLIGHPSCEGGIATGTHVHMARKYNGEWILADGPLPFNLSGWVAQAGSLPYQGALNKGDETVLACTCASKETLISR